MQNLYPGPIVLASGLIPFTALDAAGRERNGVPGIRNDGPVGVLIDKIVIRVNNGAVEGALIQLRWRNEVLTNGFAVVGAIAHPVNRAYEGYGFVVRLSKPMYLPPGEFIDVSLRNDLAVGAGGLADNAIVVAIGVQAEEPAEKWLPYLTSFVGAAYTNGSGAAISDQSAAPQLGNPFDVPLYIDRMIGRVLECPNGAGVLWQDFDPSPVWSTFLVRISDHLDRFWVPTPTAMPAVFNAIDRSWMLRHSMEAKGFLTVSVEGTANQTDGTASSRAIVGLVGHRRIA